MKNPLQAPLQQLQQKLQEPLAQLRAQLDQRTQRERVLLVGGGVILLLLALYQGLWEPLVNAHESRREALDEARALAVRIESAAQLAQSSQGVANRRISILAAVDQSSREPTLGKAPTRVQPDGDGETSVKVWLDEVSFDNLLRWLGELQSRYAITVQSAEIEAGTAAGAVNVRLTLGR